MTFSYKKLEKLLDKRGLSYNKLFEIKVLTDHSSRKMRAGDSVEVKYLAAICNYLEVPIEDVVEIIKDSE